MYMYVESQVNCVRESQFKATSNEEIKNVRIFLSRMKNTKMCANHTKCDHKNVFKKLMMKKV